MSEERELSEVEASKAVMLLVLEEAVTAVKSLVSGVVVESELKGLKEAEGLLKHMQPSVFRAMKIIKAVEGGVSELRRLVKAIHERDCDSSVNIARCFEFSLDAVVKDILRAVDLPVADDETEEEDTVMHTSAAR